MAHSLTQVMLHQAERKLLKYLYSSGAFGRAADAVIIIRCGNAPISASAADGARKGMICSLSPNEVLEQRKDQNDGKMMEMDEMPVKAETTS
jgi:hypothetical protein